MNRAQGIAVAIVIGTGSIVVALGFSMLLGELKRARESGETLSRLEDHVIGGWRGQNPCAGHYVFHRDGSYELSGFGPGGESSAGFWEFRWDGLPPTLALICTASDFGDDIGRTRELRIVRLDGERLDLQYTGRTVYRYLRAGEEALSQRGR